MSGFRTTTKRHGWRLAPDGADPATAIAWSMMVSGTGSLE
jgi:hypothetical protein